MQTNVSTLIDAAKADEEEDHIEDLDFEIHLQDSHFGSPSSTKPPFMSPPKDIKLYEVAHHHPQENSNDTNNTATSAGQGSTSLVEQQQHLNILHENGAEGIVEPFDFLQKEKGNEEPVQYPLLDIHVKTESPPEEIYMEQGNIFASVEGRQGGSGVTMPKKRGRKPGQKWKKKTNEEKDEDYKIEDEEESEKNENVLHFEDVDDEEEDETERSKESQEEGWNDQHGKGTTNERKEYTVYEDFRIMEATDDYIMKNGSKGLQSITMWQKLLDPLTGEKVLYKVRSYESMRDRYKRYIMLLNAEDKQVIREFVRNNPEEIQKRNHCLFKKVQKKRRFIGIAEQLNYDPVRIKRHTPYNTKFAEKRNERRKLLAMKIEQEEGPKKKRGRKRKDEKRSLGDMKGKVEIGFETGKDEDGFEGNGQMQGDNYFEDDISNFAESQLVVQRNNQQEWMGTQNQGEAGFPTVDELRRLSASMSRFGSRKENSNSLEFFESKAQLKDNLQKRAFPFKEEEKNSMGTKKFCTEEEKLGKKKTKRKNNVKSSFMYTELRQQECDEPDFSRPFGSSSSENGSRRYLFDGKSGHFVLSPEFDLNHNYSMQQEMDFQNGSIYQGGQDYMKQEFSGYPPLDGYMRNSPSENSFNRRVRPGSVLKEVQSEEEIYLREKKACAVFGKKAAPEAVSFKDIKILADHITGIRQFVKEIPVFDISQSLDPGQKFSLQELGKKYGYSLNEMLDIFGAMSCNFKDLNEWLQTKASHLIWTHDDDKKLLQNQYSAMLVAIKGEERVKERLRYLGY